ncbi:MULTISPECIES: amidase family protein [Moraxella]|uniref:Asp-tRNAAsn/Glu-tRNAGln amidotransferase A subunit and related amidase n=1 Tax=Moraxella catarrhalis TaxID=480 RepID=A0A7Z0UYE8_MORCA|nr:amidase family protein [Moraxella catarrhalis]OAV00659.1 Asp-tRNAAsn/Glu-tRNAGln amidotransferase A subunit and related amidase [Moraxella catarrhalis]STY82873.1 Mandelamide hydrolase [Moraxella catarrhalis]
MNIIPHAHLTALQLSRLYQAGTTTPSQVISDIYKHIDIAPHTFISLTQNRAIMQAQQATERWQAGYPLSIFDGIPIAYKDLFDIKGTITTAGSLTRQDAFVAKHDAAQVAKLTRMGLVGIGKTNLSEYAYSGLGLNPHYGTPLNTVNPKHIPGGSSSGSATAVGSGLVPVAMGTDSAGSIRIPSAFNGLVGHRASTHRYDMTGIFPLAHSVDTTGGITKDAADSYLMDELLLGCDTSAWLDADYRPSFMDSTQPTFYVDTCLVSDCDDDVLDNFYTFINKLRYQGFRVIEKPFDTLKQVLTLIDSGHWIGVAEAYTLHAELLSSQKISLMDQRVYARLMKGKDIPASTQIQIYKAKYVYQKLIARELGAGLLLLPTVAHVAPQIAPLETDSELFAQANLAALRLTMIGSFLDLAVVAMPSGLGNYGLPTSVSILGLTGTDKQVLQSAYKIAYDSL